MQIGSEVLYRQTIASTAVETRAVVIGYVILFPCMTAFGPLVLSFVRSVERLDFS